MYTLGIDVGASSVKLAALEGAELVWTAYELHRGAPTASLARLLDQIDAQLGFASCAGVAATGSGAAALLAGTEELAGADEPGGPAGLQVPLLADVPAIVAGARFLAPGAESVIAIGGQAAYFVTGVADAGDGGVLQFAQNESCAAGTGSFFEDQMGRLGLSIGDYSDLVAGARTVPRLSGRCAVFAKTDIIHLQQEGVPIRDILLGLCYALVRSYKATIVRSLPVGRPVVLAGGVVRNAGMARAVSDVFKLGEGELVTGDRFAFLQAVGAAAEAARFAADRASVRGSFSCGEHGPEKHGSPSSRAVSCSRGEGNCGWGTLLARLREASGRAHAGRDDLVRLPALMPFRYDPGRGFETLPEPWPAGADGKTPCFLGVDVGSTSTNLVLVDEQGQLLDAQYLRTGGDAEEAVRAGLASLGERLGGRVRVLACATTGSGRERMGRLVGADVVRDEITAQARAAVAADSQVDTVFEIGGQDSKFIALHAGQVADFQMNKICAAGTGSFVEEQAERLGIELDRYGELALSSSAPLDLGERCTVFVETAINAALAKGAPLADIAAGLACSIVRNYLHKVVGAKQVGRRIVLQGGVAFNPAIVAAFSAYYPDRLTVSPWFAVSGAVGAALLAAEAYEAGEVVQSGFRGFDLSAEPKAKTEVDPEEVRRNLAFFEKTRDLLTADYTGKRDPAKKTVGIPRALLMHKFFALANAFFAELGYNVVFTDDSDEQTVALAQESTQGEVCYPVKLLHGHMRKLLDEGVDYIFMPSVHTIRHAKSHVPHNFACPYMQTAPGMAARGLDLESRGIALLSPELDLDLGQEGMASAMMDVGAALGESPRATARALMAGGFAVNRLDRVTEALGDELLDSVKPGERVIVLLTRQYGAYDAVLNCGIPQELIRRGHKVAVLSNLRAHNMNVGPDHPGLCWPFGQHLVSGAKMIRRDPRLFMVYLTNHGCGPDTMMTHLIAEEMGDKPYLHIEVDEHFSKVGTITRIEAFLNALSHYEAPVADALIPLYTKNYRGVNAPLEDDGRVLCLPDYGQHARLLAGHLRAKGREVELMAPDAEAVSRGHDVDVTKEYLSFTALAGMSLAHAAESPATKRLVLPTSVGAEPEAVYDRAIRGLLDERGLADVRISAFQLERLPWNVEDPQALFDVLLAGDEWYVRNAGQAGSHGPHVVAVGEWPLVYSDELSSGAWGMFERRGVRVERMPLAEYFLFLWRDTAEDDRHEKLTAPMPLDGIDSKPAFGFDLETGHCAADCTADCDVVTHASPASPRPAVYDPNGGRDPEEVYQERIALLDRFESQMAQASERLGAASPYDDFAELRTVADEVMGNYRGANGRYRAAKARVAGARADGVVTAASMYENTQLVLNLKAADSGVPTLNLSFDGALDHTLEERIGSFLYYL